MHAMCITVIYHVDIYSTYWFLGKLNVTWMMMMKMLEFVHVVACVLAILPDVFPGRRKRSCLSAIEITLEL